MKKFTKKTYLIITLLLVITVCAPLGIYAILQTVANPVENTFVGSFVDVAVVEKGATHEDSKDNSVSYPDLRNENESVDKVVTVKNIATGNNASAMYTRVRILPSIVHNENGSVLGGSVKLTYTMKQNTSWKMNGDVFYYASQVGAGVETDILLEKVTLNQSIPSDYHLELKVMADSIAIRPETVLKSAWGLTNGFADLAAVPVNITIGK